MNTRVELAMQLALSVSLLVLSGLLYWPGLDGPLLFDDWDNLLELRRWIEGQQSVWQVIFGNHSGPTGRPLSMASFALTAALIDPSPWGIKAGNLLIHLLTAAGVFALCRRLHGCTSPAQSATKRGSARWFALAVAGLWLLHPIHVSTVLYAVQRMTQLASLFEVLSLIAFVHYRARLNSGPSQSDVVKLFVVPAGLGILALLCKETAVLLPLLYITIELSCFRQSRPAAARLFGAGCVLAVVVSFAVWIWISRDALTQGYASREFSMLERLLTQPRVVADYLGQLLLPRWREMTLFHDGWSASTGLLSPITTLLSMAFLVALTVIAIRLRRVRPLISFGLLFFLVAHSLEATFLPLELYFEHRNYLPSIGIAIASVDAVLWALGALGPASAHTRFITPVALGLAWSVLGSQTLALSRVWADAQSLYAHSLSAHPESARARLDFALLLEHRRQPDAALQLITPLMTSGRPAQSRLAQLYAATLRCMLAQEHPLDDLHQSAPRHFHTGDLVGLGRLADTARQKLCSRINLTSVRALIAHWIEQSEDPETDSERWRLRYLLAQLHAEADNPDQAISQLAIAWGPGNAHVAIGGFLAHLQLEQGLLESAAGTIEEIDSRMDPTDQMGKRNLLTLRARLERAREDEG